MEALVGSAPLAVGALVCLVMMVFMMRGMHGGQSGRSCHTMPADEDRQTAPDDAAAAKLHEMEKEVAVLRREVAERNAAKLGLGRQGRS